MVDGLTVVLPLRVAAPKFDEVTEVALVELHVSVELLPKTIDEGDALKETVGDGTTVTVVLAVAVLPVEL